MNETEITVVGNVVDTPRRNRLPNGSVTNFRMAATARRFDPDSRSFVDSSTFWIDVACWGDLGGNVARSVSKGDPVIVRGSISTDSWDTEAGRRSASKVRAVAVGLNLARGHAEFHKQARTAPAAGMPAAGERIDGERIDGERIDGERIDGEPVAGEPVDGPEGPGPEPFDEYADRPTDYVGASAALYPATADDLDAERAPEPTLT